MANENFSGFDSTSVLSDQQGKTVTSQYIKIAKGTPGKAKSILFFIPLFHRSNTA